MVSGIKRDENMQVVSREIWEVMKTLMLIVCLRRMRENGGVTLGFLLHNSR